jgi:hypothetical protein
MKESNISQYLPVLLISVMLGCNLGFAQVNTVTISGIIQDGPGAANGRGGGHWKIGSPQVCSALPK